MAQPKIIIAIFDDTHGQPIGAEIQAILEQESRYQVYLSGELLADRPLNTDTRPDLIIPFLQFSKERAVKLLAMLREKNIDALLLPVLKPEDLNEMLDELALWTDDFLVTPLRAAEVLERVRRVLSQSRQQKRHKPNKKAIDSLSLAAQVKLLRFLENHTYHALGSARERHADVWIVAASNRDLKKNIVDGAFREDLFYRLAVMNLRLPSLRERKVDIPVLVNHLWSRYADRHESEARQLSPRAMAALHQYSWPGNIRELENVIQQLLVLSDVQIIEPEDLPIPVTVPLKSLPVLSFNQARAKVIATFEKTYVSELLQNNNGNVSHAAKAANKERRSFGRLIKKLSARKALSAPA